MEDIKPQGFIYTFKVSDTEPNFSMLPDHVQSQIEKYIVDVIYESFVIPADHDYLTARALAIGGLHRNFFWAASQAVEKYLKAFLLLNGVSVVGDLSKGHGLNPLLTAAGMVEPGFDDIDLAPHPELQLPIGGVQLTHFTLSTYIKELEKQGSAANRYNSEGESYNTGHLFALDSLAYRLRKKMGVPELATSFRGRLSTDFRRYLYDNNLYYAPKDYVHTELPSAVFPIRASMSATTWEYVKSRECQWAVITKRWLKTKMKIV